MLTIFSQAAKLLGKQGGGRRIAPIRKKPRRNPLNVERLEDRTVPTADSLLALPDLAATTQNLAVNIAVLANDTGPGPLSVVSVTQGNLGPASVHADNTITYVPLAPGEDTLSYTITNGSSQASGQVLVYVLPTEYDVYVWKVSQADFAYSNSMQAADAERQSAITNARADALAAASQLYADYQASVSEAYEAYVESVDGAGTAYDSAIQSADSAWQASYDAASGEYNNALGDSQQAYDDAVFSAQQSQQSAQAAADAEYLAAIAPYQTAWDAAYANVQANPQDPEAQAVVAQAQGALDQASAEAEAVRDAAYADGLIDYQLVESSAADVLAASQDGAQANFEMSLAPAHEAWSAADASAKAAYTDNKAQADSAYVGAEPTAWSGYVNALADLEANLAGSETIYQGQFEVRASDALAAWYSAEQTAWNTYLTNLASLPGPPEPGARILEPAPILLVAAQAFPGLALQPRAQLVMLPDETADQRIALLNGYSAQIDALLNDIGDASGEGAANNLFSRINPVIARMEGYLTTMEDPEADGAAFGEARNAYFDERRNNLHPLILAVLDKANRIRHEATLAQRASERDAFRIVGINSDLRKLKERLDSLANTLEGQRTRLATIRAGLDEVTQAISATLISSVISSLDTHVTALRRQTANIFFAVGNQPATGFAAGLNLKYAQLVLLQLTASVDLGLINFWSRLMTNLEPRILAAAPGTPIDDTPFWDLTEFNSYFQVGYVDPRDNSAGSYLMRLSNFSACVAILPVLTDAAIDILDEVQAAIDPPQFAAVDQFRKKGVQTWRGIFTDFLLLTDIQINRHIGSLTEIREALPGGFEFALELARVDNAIEELRDDRLLVV